ncbi:MAG TPA: serine hydrolase [Candidatus Methanoperedens sp.]|nr:serine hydrolase [Candidatus Methanoperedens sp.]
MFSKYNLLIFFSGLILFFCGLYLGRIIPHGQNSEVTETRNQEGYKFINPLLECESTEFSKTAALEPLRKKLTSVVESQKNLGNISYASIYLRDLNGGPWLGINERDNFSPASLVKVPLMMTYYKAAEKRPELLNETITIESTYDSSQSILPEITLAPKQAYTIDELISRMIIYSDNQAYELLQSYIDNKLIIKTYTDLGVDLSQAYDNPNGNILSVKYYASFFRILFNASYLNKDMSEKALHLLSQVKYKDGLVKGINNPIINIAHKFGERTYEETNEKQLHDCGIVYLPNKPHLICIMTRGSDFSRLNNTIVELTKVIYKELL